MEIIISLLIYLVSALVSIFLNIGMLRGYSLLLKPIPMNPRHYDFSLGIFLGTCAPLISILIIFLSTNMAQGGLRFD